jgi:putative transposase
LATIGQNQGMTPDSACFRLVLATFAGWVNREQQAVIDYLQEENRVLKQQLGGRRLRLTDSQRRRLAAKGKALGRRLLARIATIVSPDTILAWHRRLIAAKWTFPRKSSARAGVMLKIREHALRFAKENPSWGYRRIQGALANLGHKVAFSTIAKLLREAGVPPAPERPTTWTTFIRSHADVIVAADFFTTEVWTPRGLVTYYTLFVIDIGSRAVEVLGTTPHPDGAFMQQIARNLIDEVDGFLRNKRYLITDRDATFTVAFRKILKDAGVEVVRTAFKAPNQNAFAERFVRSIKSECLDRMILFGEASLIRAQREFIAHYLTERNHQGLGNRLISGDLEHAQAQGEALARERLGGLLRYYYRAAA